MKFSDDSGKTWLKMIETSLAGDRPEFVLPLPRCEVDFAISNRNIVFLCDVCVGFASRK